MSSEIIYVGNLEVQVTRKSIRHMYLSVEFPMGDVVLTAPRDAKVFTLRLFVLDKYGWLRRQLAKCSQLVSHSTGDYISGSNVFVNNKRYVLHIVDENSDLANKTIGNRIYINKV